MKVILRCCLLCLLPTAALACPTASPLPEELRAKADDVFTGRLQSIRRVAPNGPALLEFRAEGKRGQKPRTVKAYWRNGTFGEPLSVAAFRKSYGRRTRVGLATPNAWGEARHCELISQMNAGTGFSSPTETCSSPLTAGPVEGQPDLPWVVQGPCTEPYLSRVGK